MKEQGEGQNLIWSSPEEFAEQIVAQGRARGYVVGKIEKDKAGDGRTSFCNHEHCKTEVEWMVDGKFFCPRHGLHAIQDVIEEPQSWN
jgi:hypothetical protein